MCLSWVQPWDRQQCAARGGEIWLQLTGMICPWAGNLTTNFWKMSNPHPKPCLPPRLSIDKCITTKVGDVTSQRSLKGRTNFSVFAIHREMRRFFRNTFFNQFRWGFNWWDTTSKGSFFELGDTYQYLSVLMSTVIKTNGTRLQTHSFPHEAFQFERENKFLKRQFVLPLYFLIIAVHASWRVDSSCWNLAKNYQERNLKFLQGIHFTISKIVLILLYFNFYNG